MASDPPARRAYRKHRRPQLANYRAGERAPDVLSGPVRVELREAKDEHLYRLRRFRAEKQCRSGAGCADDVCAQLLDELYEAKANLLAVVWACTHGRGATAREVAEVLGVDPRTVERYKTEFEEGIGGN